MTYKNLVPTSSSARSTSSTKIN